MYNQAIVTSSKTIPTQQIIKRKASLKTVKPKLIPEPTLTKENVNAWLKERFPGEPFKHGQIYLKISDHSMYCKKTNDIRESVTPGNAIIFSVNEKPENGSFVLIVDLSTKKIYFRKYQVVNNRVLLRAYNACYEDIWLDEHNDHIVIWGAATALVTNCLGDRERSPNKIEELESLVKNLTHSLRKFKGQMPREEYGEMIGSIRVKLDDLECDIYNLTKEQPNHS